MKRHLTLHHAAIENHALNRTEAENSQSNLFYLAYTYLASMHIEAKKVE